jgi:cytoskeletal protein CcmA (bactofilin family)
MDKTETLIDAESSFEGKLRGKNASILGTFKGEIELTGTLVTGERSKVDAKVKASSVEIAGKLVGEVHAERILLIESARVDATLDGAKLGVREGAQLNGGVSAGVGGDPRPGPRPPVASLPSTAQKAG